jgi:hypothetical protein
MSTIALNRGAINYLMDAFGVNNVAQLNSEQAATLCEDAELDFQSESGELWSAYCGANNLMAHQTAEKFRNSKFYREHL